MSGFYREGCTGKLTASDLLISHIRSELQYVLGLAILTLVFKTVYILWVFMDGQSIVRRPQALQCVC